MLRLLAVLLFTLAGVLILRSNRPAPEASGAPAGTVTIEEADARAVAAPVQVERESTHLPDSLHTRERL